MCPAVAVNLRLTSRSLRAPPGAVSVPPYISIGMLPFIRRVRVRVCESQTCMRNNPRRVLNLPKSCGKRGSEPEMAHCWLTH